jgi:hypothetical protein
LFGTKGPAIAACIFSNPTTRWSESVLELTRLIRIEGITISLTGLISATCQECRRQGFHLLISFADSTQGHHGGIYQAASWNYHGKRESAMDGLVISGRFVPGRTCNALYGTRSPERLAVLHPDWPIEPHHDDGKHLYWRALDREGESKAGRLELKRLPYPKPEGRPANEIPENPSHSDAPPGTMTPEGE